MTSIMNGGKGYIIASVSNVHLCMYVHMYVRMRSICLLCMSACRECRTCHVCVCVACVTGVAT